MSIKDEARAGALRKKAPDRYAAKKSSGRSSRPARYSGERFADTSGSRPVHEAKTAAPKGDITDRIIVAAAAAVLIACVVILGIYFYQMFEAKKNHEDIKNIYERASASAPAPAEPLELEVILPEADAPAAAETAPAAAKTDKDSTDAAADSTDGTAQEDNDAPAEEKPVYREPLTILPAAQELLAINSDTVGYVKIPGVLEEVVVQTDNNDYYLTHNFYKNQRYCGTVFADRRNIVNNYPDLMSDNIILYGHNEKNGTMFGNMDYYRWDPEYRCKNNPFIYFNTNYEEGTYVIVASFVTNAKPEDDNGNIFDYWNITDLSSEEMFDYFVKEITERSMIITDVDVRHGDKFLTLSTCSTEWDDSRHAIVARKLRDGETEEDIDTSLFRKNPDPKWPAQYYKINGGSYSGT